MNVTNRRKSTDADTPTNQPTQQQQQQHQSLLAYVSCRQAATATTTTRSRHDQLLLQQQQHQHQQYKEEEEDDEDEEDEDDEEEEQDQVVTSTSSDCGVLLPLTAEGEGEEVTLELEASLVTTSPARITSSTNNYEHLTYNSDSLSLEEMPVMPTTSENARLENATETSARASASALKLIHHSINNNNTRSSKANDMVARDTSLTSIAEAGGDKTAAAGGREGSFNEQASTSSNSEVTTENHKLILKLPKTESQQNSLMEDDLRKVEPLKINLHNTSHHLSSLHHTPKITIKPIVKNPAPDIMVSSEECSSSAEEEMVSKLHNSEPHIVPKLTIRAKNEELGMTHSTVVPKLTIKINDSNNSNTTLEALAHTQPAASTPPLPKLTIKTGQDGHSESIITNISPASSTTSSSSSSLASSSGSSCLTLTKDTTSVPKFTIKPLHKPHDSSSDDKSNEKHPSIPKLCIKGNMICGGSESTCLVNEEASSNKVPKLTIKTGQEHAVIITQHNDHNSSGGGTGIPKLTIKTKSLEVNEDSSTTSNASVSENSLNEKIPKITIKTNTNESANIVATKQRLVKSHLEQQPTTTPPSPKQQAVPKLTISRQQNDMVVTNKHTLHQGEDAGTTIPKMTIKTQSKTETVPKLTIKTINKTKRPSTTEESGISDDNEEDDEEEEEDEQYEEAQQTKTVPKLTIKNLGSPQQKLKVVQNQETNTTTTTNPTPLATALTNTGNLLISSSPRDLDEFADLLMVDNCAEESSNSQEFCGFNDNTGDSSAKHIKQVSHNAEPNLELEIRRNSDDMDIDEDLQTEHEPQIFQNVTHFITHSHEQPLELLNGNVQLQLHHTKLTEIIDTVDLTSSSSRSCSPTQFDYNDDDSNPPLTMANNIPATNILMERLQRETTVIQTTQQHLDSASPNIPPPLQPKPPHAIQTSPASLKYPQLAERLMANGGSPTNNKTIFSPDLNVQTPRENIIDSIEILDTPEGSPRNSLDECPESLKITTSDPPSSLPNGLHYHNETDIIITHNNNNSNLKRPALGNNNLAGQTNSTRESNADVLPPSKLRRLNNDTPKNNQTIVNNNNDNLIKEKVFNNSFEDLNNVAETVPAAEPKTTTVPAVATITPHQRARKQKHEHIIPIAMEEVNATNSNDSFDLQQDNSNDNTNENSTPVIRKRGRPKKTVAVSMDGTPANTPQLATPLNKEETPQMDVNSKSRRVQLLRKRLAIDMVDAEPPLAVLEELETTSNANAVQAAAEAATAAAEEKQERDELEQQRRDRSLRIPLRTSRRSNTPSMLQMESSRSKTKAPSALAVDNNNKKSSLKQTNENVLNHFLESNSSISSVCSNTSSTLTSTLASVAVSVSVEASASATQTLNSTTIALSHTQIDLTMSSSSSNSNGSTTNTITTVEAATHTSKHNILGGGGGGGSSNNSMLPPTTILSSDPLPDVIFKPNDFSSIIATQQLRAPLMGMDQAESQEEDVADDVSCADNSGDDSASSSSMSNTPGRGRVRGRGSRGGRGRAYKAHRLGRGASAVSKAIAMNRPRCVGALKHTPDPERMKGLYSPSPSVFEEDTRMSADMTQNSVQLEPPQIPFRQPDFLNNEESQSSIISNTSILDPNTVTAVQNVSGSAVKKIIKRKKMEVCVAEDADITVSSIAEYDWPPPKGCCPSKNRDTFMIQEQVALYLGIKSFKRKYPDLPRRQIDMEERNYLQEKSLVSEKMCDLGITAVWASDILDIMYTDFYDKYEEYKDFVRQKHLREIEAKQKSLGLNVAGRGLQARERAMLSTSKWNAYFNRTRKDERISCLDLQTLTVNIPCPASAPIAAISYRPMADAVALAAKAEQIPEPPTLLKPRLWEPVRPREVYYPLSLVPGQFCKNYYDYSAQELRQFPLNTVLDHSSHIWPKKEDVTDTDSATEAIHQTADVDKSSNTCATERLNQQRRVRRTRAKHARKLNNEEFKVPPVPGAISTTCSTDSCSSSDDSSSETDSDSSCSSSSSSEESSEDENTPATCGVCQHPQNRNLKDIPELFVQCYTCRRKVHPSCIEMPHRMSTRVRNYNWQCADCKCCIKCKRKQDQNKMLYCEQCDRGFHVYCLGVKAVPDGRWSCERCSICMRCGATKPEGLPLVSSTGEKIKQVKHKKVKWINDYRIDHITKLREHCSMLCVPCGRTKTLKRVQINTHNNTTNIYTTSPGSNSGGLSPSSSQTTATNTMTSTTSQPQMSPSFMSSANAAVTNISNSINQAANNSNVTTSLITPLSSSSSSSYSAAATASATSLESKDSTSIYNPHTSSSINTTTPQHTTSAAQATTAAATTLTSSSSPLSIASTTSTNTTTVGVAPPAVA